MVSRRKTGGRAASPAPALFSGVPLVSSPSDRAHRAEPAAAGGADHRSHVGADPRRGRRRLFHRPAGHRCARRHRAGLPLPDADDEHRHGRHGRQRRRVDGACPGRGANRRCPRSRRARAGPGRGERTGLHRLRVVDGARALRADGWRRWRAGGRRRLQSCVVRRRRAAVAVRFPVVVAARRRRCRDAWALWSRELDRLRAAGRHPGVGHRPVARARPRRAGDCQHGHDGRHCAAAWARLVARQAGLRAGICRRPPAAPVVRRDIARRPPGLADDAHRQRHGHGDGGPGRPLRCRRAGRLRHRRAPGVHGGADRLRHRHRPHHAGRCGGRRRRLAARRQGHLDWRAGLVRRDRADRLDGRPDARELGAPVHLGCGGRRRQRRLHHARGAVLLPVRARPHALLREPGCGSHGRARRRRRRAHDRDDPRRLACRREVRSGIGGRVRGDCRRDGRLWRPDGGTVAA